MKPLRKCRYDVAGAQDVFGEHRAGAKEAATGARLWTFLDAFHPVSSGLGAQYPCVQNSGEARPVGPKGFPGALGFSEVPQGCNLCLCQDSPVLYSVNSFVLEFCVSSFEKLILMLKTV